jgi:integrase
VWYWREQINGKLYVKSTKFSDNRKAVKRASQFRAAILEGDAGWMEVKVAPLLRVWWDTFYETHSNQTNDRKALPFIEHYGSRRMDQITSDECQAWINARLQATNRRGTTFKAGNVRSEVIALAKVWNRAIKSKKVTENPWRGLNRPEESQRERVLTKSEEPILYAALGQPGRLTYDPVWMQRLMVVVLGSGLRRREIGLLRPVDVVNGCIHVRRETAKGRKARVVPIKAETLQILEEQRQARGLAEDSSERLWPMSLWTLGEAFLVASRRAGIPNVTLHDLRRTFGTRRAMSGMPPKVLQLLMGHTKITVTMKFYVSVDVDQLSHFVAIDTN